MLRKGHCVLLLVLQEGKEPDVSADAAPGGSTTATTTTESLVHNASGEVCHQKQSAGMATCCGASSTCWEVVADGISGLEITEA
eukprot:579997-Amphidinium_carterae.2